MSDKNFRVKNGIEIGILGDASLPAISFVTDPNTGIFSPIADVIGFSVGGLEKVRLISSGNLLLGTTSDNGVDVLQINGSVTNTRTKSNAGTAGTPAFVFNGDLTTGIFQGGAGIIGFSSSGTEIFRVQSTGIVATGNATFNGASPIISAKIGPVSGQQHTVPAIASDTLALLAATQTFTNKTLTSPIISGGTINNNIIGGTTPAAASFTSVTASSTVQGTRFISTVGNGTVPFTLSSSTQVPLLNASFLEGFTTATGASINTIVLRTSSGYINGVYLNQSSATETPTIGNIFVENSGADGYLRKISIANFSGQLSTVGGYYNSSNQSAGTLPSARLSGTYGISVTGNAGTVAGLSVSSAASASTVAARDGSGYLFAVYFNASGPTNGGLPSPAQVWSSNGDGYLYKTSIAQLGTILNSGGGVVKLLATLTTPANGAAFVADARTNIGTVSGAKFVELYYVCIADDTSISGYSAGDVVRANYWVLTQGHNVYISSSGGIVIQTGRDDANGYVAKKSAGSYTGIGPGYGNQTKWNLTAYVYG